MYDLKKAIEQANKVMQKAFKDFPSTNLSRTFLTELKAIGLSRILWKELYEKFPIAKIDTDIWPLVGKFAGGCPCCEYYGKCEECPLEECYSETKLTDWVVWINFMLGYEYEENNTNCVEFNKAKQAAKNIFEKLDKKYQELLKEKENDKLNK
jgi:hypothetical protein